MTIGALSLQTHYTVPTIRYYAPIGLLPRPWRAPNGHRHYRDEDLKRLSFIKRCRDFGFPIEQVRELTSLFEDGGCPCVEVRDRAQLHLDQVRARLDTMRQLEAKLARFGAGCDASGVGGTTGSCVITGDIAASCATAAPPFFSTELKHA
jgi:DNA-binding transcriptional MerR regulator